MINEGDNVLPSQQIDIFNNSSVKGIASVNYHLVHPGDTCMS